MTKPEKTALLSEKLKERQREYEANIKEYLTDEIVEDVCSYVQKSDIVDMLKEMSLSEEQIDALLSFDDPIEEIYENLGYYQPEYFDILRHALLSYVDDKVFDAKQEGRKNMNGN